MCLVCWVLDDLDTWNGNGLYLHTNGDITFDALIGCGTTNIPDDDEGNVGKCGWLEGGDAELEDSGLWDAWWLYSPDISWSWSSRPPSEPDNNSDNWYQLESI